MTNTIEHMDELLDLPRREATMNMMDFVSATMAEGLTKVELQMAKKAAKLKAVSFRNQKKLESLFDV